MTVPATVSRWTRSHTSLPPAGAAAHPVGVSRYPRPCRGSASADLVGIQVSGQVVVGGRPVRMTPVYGHHPCSAMAMIFAVPAVCQVHAGATSGAGGRGRPRRPTAVPSSPAEGTVLEAGQRQDQGLLDRGGRDAGGHTPDNTSGRLAAWSGAPVVSEEDRCSTESCSSDHDDRIASPAAGSEPHSAPTATRHVPHPAVPRYAHPYGRAAPSAPRWSRTLGWLRQPWGLLETSAARQVYRIGRSDRMRAVDVVRGGWNCHVDQWPTGWVTARRMV
jgi:hypothetical protein